MHRGMAKRRGRGGKEGKEGEEGESEGENNVGISANRFSTNCYSTLKFLE